MAALFGGFLLAGMLTQQPSDEGSADSGDGLARPRDAREVPARDRTRHRGSGAYLHEVDAIQSPSRR